ncbi:MAG: hypothetical protein ABI658_14860, partial [Acidimicrobiales bacterium]
GAGGGRPRKPEGMARHKNPSTRGTITIDADAKVDVIPEPSLPLTGVRREIWDEMWAQPIATLWNRSDLAALTRLVIIQTTLAAYDDKGLLAEMRQLEDRFLLNPYSRAQQRVVIGGDVDDRIGGDVAWFNDAKRRLRGPA